MNLLTDDWIPVRLLLGGRTEWITLCQLLTDENEYEICLPRDDLELAAVQLLICITQVLFVPKDLKDIVKNLRTPIKSEEYLEKANLYQDWFDVEHPKHRFMQVQSVTAKDATPMDKLMPGLTGATNSCFVNQPNQAKQICGGCAAISLFNQASNAPSFGGGFKAGLRSAAPITTLVQGRHLRETIWLNVLSDAQLQNFIPHSRSLSNQVPTWVDPIERGAEISTGSIGLLRGLFWQPAHIELCAPIKNSTCFCCGREKVSVYDGFLKAKFNYTIDGVWPHPHSPRLLSFKKGTAEQKFASFTTPAPTWTRLASFILQRKVNKEQKEGHEPAAVMVQANQLFGRHPDRLRMTIGGYRTNKASILERRHELFDLNKGWHQKPLFVQEIVEIGLGYKSGLRKSLFVFSNGLKDIKGAGVKVQELGEAQFYRRTDNLMQKALAEAHFDNPDLLALDKVVLRDQLKHHCLAIFQEQTRPYLNDPELIRTMAVARRTLNKHLKELEPEGGE